MNADAFNKIPKEKFQFIQKDQLLKDQKFDTKPVSYLQDAWHRFRRNKGSVAAAVIIIILFLYAIFVPLFSKYSIADRDDFLTYLLPKSKFLSQFGIMQGYQEYSFNQQSFDYNNAIPGCIVKVKRSYVVEDAGRKNTYYDVVVDTYKQLGYIYKLFTLAEYNEILAYEQESGKQILQPMINTNKQLAALSDKDGPNYWFLHNQRGFAEYDSEGNYQDIFLRDENGDYVYHQLKMNGQQYQVRILYYDWYVYQRGYEPGYLFGTDMYGQDIFTKLAYGARLSFILAITIASINLILGMLYGSIQGYYGGWADLVMDRVADILYNIPSIVVMTLFQIHLAKQVGPVISLLFAFVAVGWISPAARVRTQFYRYKGQEYVLAARTLGARDRRIIFRHILPNTLGTLVTSFALVIPSVIFSESVLSYLGIINLESTSFTSVGTMLSNGQSSLFRFPHAIFLPALFISLLMISFNMFGNGLRDAFNPSLRGSEE